MRNTVYIVFATMLMTAGFVLLPLPIPLGLPLITIALIVLIRESRFVKRLVKRWRERNRRLNTLVFWIEKKAPFSARSILKKTRPKRGKFTKSERTRLTRAAAA